MFTIGPFELHPDKRQLLEGEREVRLGSRAFDILVALAERAGEVVAKEELLARVWPDVTVEEANLRVHVAALRHALGDGRPGMRFVTNVLGRGYCLVAPVTSRQEESPQKEAPPASPPIPAPTVRVGNLPPAPPRAIGRAKEVSALVQQMRARRLVTVTGPGGIGKTTVALAAAEQLAPAYPDGVFFVELARIAEPVQPSSALAVALGLAVSAQESPAALAAHVSDRALLIILDGCDRVVDAAASLAEMLLRAGPRVRVLATSREVLRAEGEWLQRLRPLRLPPTSTLTAAEALRYPAVQLFVERAAATLGSYNFEDAEASAVAEICRRLDGIALAIELAAGRIDMFRPPVLASLLDDRFRILTHGRRTALPHHQTLRATLDWSYSALPAADKATLRRLSVFIGDFTLAAARDVAPSGDTASSLIEDRVADLVDKSLITVEVTDEAVLFRLLDTTRAYAREKLVESGELGEVLRRHAQHLRHVFERAEAEWDVSNTEDWLSAYARQIDDLRAALHWAFSPDGDTELGVVLTVASVPLWFHLSLFDECMGWVKRALVVFEAALGQHERRRMQLHAAFGCLGMYADAGVESSVTAWRTTLRLAESLGDVDYQLRALWALWASCTNYGELSKALELAERFRRLASIGDTDPADYFVGERMTGVTLHFIGDQEGARQRLELVMDRYVRPAQKSHVVRFQFDQRVTARMMLARILWVQGFPDQAMQEVEGTIAEAMSLGHAMSLCNALAQSACPIAVLVGDITAVERHGAMLRRYTEGNTLDIWRAYADGFDGDIIIRRGQSGSGLKLLGSAVEQIRRRGFVQCLTIFLAMLGRALAAADRVEEAGAAVQEGLDHCERTGESWCLAELLRLRGEMRLRQPTAHSVRAGEIDFEESLRVARQQGALAWELRTATSLMGLRRGEGRERDGRQELHRVYTRFTEGFDTQDLRRAAAILGIGNGTADV